ncbi:MAG: hypothetical protein AAF743_08950, partial [Planctomycetota bacterium]
MGVDPKLHKPSRTVPTRRQLLASAAGAALTAPLLPRQLLGVMGHASSTDEIADATWHPVPLISREILDRLAERGLPALGGEGGQWLRDLALGPDGETAIWGTDVGGLYRSLNGGVTWEPANVGFTPRGTNCVAFDPRDASRIIAVGANTAAFERHGIYLSTDRGSSWRHVLRAEYAGVNDERRAIAFDPNGDHVYWSRTAKDDANYGKGVDHPALYVSRDRGETWAEVPDSEALGGAFLCHHPLEPVLFAGTADGLFVVRDEGRSVERVADVVVTGLDVSPQRLGRLLATTARRVIASDDGGRTWTDLPGIAPLLHADTTLRFLRVSPADADTFGLYHQRPNYNWSRLVTHDGGVTFIESTFDEQLNFLPRNVRQPHFAWHPTDPNVVLASGGDWPSRSDDGGRSFRWSAAGVNAFYCKTTFQFCPSDPDVLFFSSQDYNGAVTVDGGKTWRYTNVSGNPWGGHTYGSAAASASDLWCGKSENHWAGSRVLATSRDGGRTWHRHDSARWAPDGDNFGIDACLCDPDDAARRFAGPFRSDDGGANWHRMQDCHGVLTASAGMLFGVHRHDGHDHIVGSRDGGVSWHVLFGNTFDTIRDCAHDTERDRLYVAADNQLWQADGMAEALAERGQRELVSVQLPDVPDGLYTGILHSVAVDPRRPQIVYVCRQSNKFSHPAAALRSSDAGATWQTLTRTDPLRATRDSNELDGGREAKHVRVHPITGDAWFTTGCYGA